MDFNREIGMSKFMWVLLVTGLWVCARANPTLINLPANSWYRVSNSPMAPFCPSESQYPGIRGTGGCAMVMEAWSGGVYLPGHDLMIVWGGGHNDYYGNEVYGFNVSTLTWSRKRDPSPPNNPATCLKVLTGGTPVSRHTYDGLEYMSHVDRMFAFGGSGACYSGDGVAQTWTLSLVDSMWNQVYQWKYMNPTGPTVTSCCNSACAYDPVTRLVYYHDNKGLFAYNYDLNTWTNVSNVQDWGPKAGAMDTKRGIFVMAGNGVCMGAEVRTSPIQLVSWPTGGVSGSYGPGLTYDSKADRILGWAGGAVYSLNTETKSWSQLGGSGGPGSQLQWGTYGRFRYIPEYNVCILINGINSDVYFYKNTAGPGNVGLEKALPRALAPVWGFSNPALLNGTLVLRRLGALGPARQVALLNLQGKTLFSRSVDKGVRSISIPLKHYSSGVYLLRTDGTNGVVTQRIVVTK
jgi:hypothetical protein